ncbi:transmembrane protein 41A-B-like isoform X2 [Corythoichthys intestinalis]|uniref:transmembrane protein 41A-B-like isoform X2 n=1 Tax=Corythoichthys intestinalis TaxID=161448 RepID=UPI0025A5DDCA|nr:transmembrane protein 41A-B-like isoform X2 [Corythoichthys intestinalis]
MLSFAGLAATVAAASVYLYVLSTHLPPAAEYLQPASPGEPEPEPHYYKLKFPSDLDELRELAEMLKFYKQEHHGYVLLLFCSAYLYKQSFAIPGSSFLDVRSFVAEHVSRRHFRTLGGPGSCVPSDHHRLHILLPAVVRLWEAARGPHLPGQSGATTKQGLIPYNFICVRTGAILSEIHSLDDIFSWATLAQLLAIALVALVPGALIKRYGQTHLKVEGMDATQDTDWKRR